MVVVHHWCLGIYGEVQGEHMERGIRGLAYLPQRFFKSFLSLCCIFWDGE